MLNESWYFHERMAVASHAELVAFSERWAFFPL